MVIKTGSPMFEVLTYYRPRIDASDVLVRQGLEAGGYFVVSAHREENIESAQSFGKLVKVINAVAEDHDIPVIVSTHPRTQKRINSYRRALSSAGAAVETAGFSRLREASALCQSGAVRQRHDQ